MRLRRVESRAPRFGCRPVVSVANPSKQALRPAMTSSSSSGPDRWVSGKHLFVLDVSPWAGIADAPHNESRIQNQVAAMKLMCCSELPDKVGVVHMGASSTRVDVPLTEKWRCEGCPLDLYAPAVEVESIESAAVPDPKRIGSALDLCLAALRAEGDHDHWSDTDLFEDDDTEAVITILLCTPPVGIHRHATALVAAARALGRARVEVNFILHPNAHSPSFDDKFSWWHASGTKCSGPRCSDADMDVLDHVFHFDFRNLLFTKDFVTTCSSYNDHYLSGCLEQSQVYDSWSRCWPSQVEEKFPRRFWDWTWLHSHARVDCPKECTGCSGCSEALAEEESEVAVSDGTGTAEDGGPREAQ